jgi:Bacterial Ig domain/Right handed beta helix region
MWFILVLLLATSQAWAGEVYHVSSEGNNEKHDGRSAARPWQTIAQALSKARAGDTIQLGPGTFRERLHLRKGQGGNPLRPVTIKGTRGAKGEYQTVLDGSTPVTAEWHDEGDGVYRAQLGYDPKAMTANGYAIWRCGDHTWQGSSKCIDTLRIAPDEVWNIAVGAVKYWDGIDALFGYSDGWTYLRFRNREHPRDMGVRAAPAGGVVTISTAGVVIEGVKIVGGQYAVRVTEGAHGAVIQDSYLSHGKHRILLDGGAEGTIIRRNTLTLDGIGFRDPALPPGDWNGNSYPKIVNRHRYDENKFLVGDTETDDSSIEFRQDTGTVVTENIIRDSDAGLTFHGSTTNAEVSFNQILRHSDNCVYVNADWASVSFHHNLVADCDHLMRIQSTQQNMKWAIYANSFWQPEGTGKHIWLNAPERQPGDSVIGIYQNSHAGTGWAVDVGSDGQHVSLPFVHVGNTFMSTDDMSSFGDVSWGTMMGVHRDNIWYGTSEIPDFKLPANNSGVNNAESLDGIPGMTETYYVDGRPDYGSTQGGQGITPPGPTPPQPPTTDTTPPTVRLLTPANGARISGAAVILSAEAGDNVKIAEVRFTVDRVPVGGPQCCVSVEYSLDSTKLSNGRHEISAIATDSAGNKTTATPVVVLVSNGGTPPDPPQPPGGPIPLTCTGTLGPKAAISLTCGPQGGAQ